MKTTQKQATHNISILWVKKLFKYTALMVPLFVVLFVFAEKAKSEEIAEIQKGDVVINEIQSSGGTGKTTQEFIELYNKTNEDKNLEGFSLKKKTKLQSTAPITLVNSADFSGVVPAHGYFLISHPDYRVTISSDISFSPDLNGKFPSIASDNTVLLYDKSGNLLDKVGYGDAQDREASPAPNIPDKKSIERKDFQDTENNGADFAILETPTPLNTSYREKIDGGDEDEDMVICSGDSGSVILNEIYPNTEDEKDEFVEVTNIGDDCVDISGWAIKDSTNTSSHKTIFPEKTILDSGEYFYIEKNLYLNNDDDTVYLLNETGLEIDKREYKEAVRDKSYSLIENEWIWTLAPTKGKENILEEGEEQPIDDSAVDPVPNPIAENKIYSNKIKITELFPNPFKSQYGEYIELHNGSFEDMDLLGWTLHDGSKSGKYTFAQSVILKAQKYLAVFKEDFKFALNNSGNESVTLFDPNGKEVAKASYDGSKKNVSYNFDGARWRWSKFLTPGAENILNNEPYGNVKIDEEIFAKSYADFYVSTGDIDGDKVKVTWDFGDGHKSYLAKTRHKYSKIGTYNGSVKLSDGSEDVIKEFSVKVKKYPHPKVRIIGVNANPVGSDTLGETLTIENKSKEKINLEGWSIATGTKKLTNHPVIEKFILKKKETKEITREISKFTLNDKKGKIELRYPDGEVADKVKYDHGKVSIDEGEIYAKSNGKWEWVLSQKSIKQEEMIIDGSSVISNQPASSADGSSDANESNAEEKVAGVEITKRKYSFVMLENKVSIGKMEFKNSDARVLRVESVREVDGQYFLTPQGKELEHYAIIFLKNVSSNINTKTNLFLNYFLK